MTTSKDVMNASDSVLKHTRGWLLGLGILFVFLGCIGLGMVVGLTIASMVFFGVLLILAGFSNLADVFKNKQWQGAMWQAIISILYIVGGCVVIYDPLLASSLITIMLAAVFMVMGISRLLMLMSVKDVQGWGWLFVSGLAALVLGIMILMQWPMSALWFIGMLIAIEMIVNGWTYIFIALSMPKV